METLKKNITALYQEKGWQWLNDLPDQLIALENQLQIQLEKPFDDLSYNYAAPAKDKTGKSLVFKYGMPNKELSTEIDALKLYKGQGAVQLIAADADQGWLLIELCKPGHRLTTITNDVKATVIAISVMQSLFRPIHSSSTFPSIADWLRKLQPTEKIPKLLLEFAQTTAKDLLSSQGEPVLLHGDLHHYNILSSQRDHWLAIDPKGVIGEREYEVGALMRNPQTQLLTKAILKTRLDIISEHTGFDRQRLLLWSVVQAVLSARWCLEDGVDGSEELIQLAQKLYSLVN